MKRALLAALLTCLSFTAEARPSPFRSVTIYNGDRVDRVVQMGADVARAVREQRRSRARHHRKHRTRSAPVVRQIGLAEGMTREAGRALHGRPRAWCGWWLGHHLGMPFRHLWLARNWASVGSPAQPGPGVIVVWRHHVGIITGRHGNQWVVKSGNDGRRVRERPRSIAGAIAFRRV